MEAFPRKLVLALGLFLCFAAAVSGVNTAFKNQDCSGGSYGTGDYSSCVDHVVGAMTTVTATIPQYKYSIKCPFQVIEVAYGKSECASSLTINDCVACLGIAKANIQQKCANVKKVKMELEDCFMQYGPDPL